LEKQKKQKCDRELIKINARDDSKKEERAQKTREQKKSTHGHLDSPGRLAADFHVEEHDWVRHLLVILYLFFLITQSAYVLCRPVK